MTYRTLFSYYGGKSKVIHKYPRPRHKLIIEPFAGSATYAIHWRFRRQVILNDLNKPTYLIWKFLQTHTTKEVLSMVPSVERGTDISTIADPGSGLFYFLRCWGARGIGGVSGEGVVGHKLVTEFGIKRWHSMCPSIRRNHPPVPSWTVLNKDYSKIKNREATWFVDPPYNNKAGSLYHNNQIDYDHLAHWCRTRKGFVIVCENEGATWLPFRPLVKGRPRASYKQDINESKEVIWTSEKVGLLF